MYRPCLELVSFERLPHEAKVGVIVAMIEALILVDRAWLRLVPTPALYAAGVRYLREPVGRDHFQDIPRTQRLASGDCEDLVAWRVAELREGGEAGAAPVVQSFQVGGVTFFHVLVQRADGTSEDPSRRLGMP